MKIFKKLAALTIASAMAVSGAASAMAFSDMPSGAMGVAIENAVSNGLLTGYDDNTVKPNDPITRAQMSAIIVRAFGATEKEANNFADVADDAWYREAVEKAVYMGAFKGDDQGNFNPENNITFQETYTVLARVFQFTERINYQNVGILSPAEDCLDDFADKDQVASWAVEYAKAVVDKGGYTGINGLLKPTDSITRGEFAMVMDELVSLYIDKEGTYTTGFGNGTVVVRSGGVTIDGLNTSKNLILSYGIDKETVVKNSTVDGCVVIYGGTDKTPVQTNGKLTADESFISITLDSNATIYDCRIFAPYSITNIDCAKLNAETDRIPNIKGYAETSIINLGSIG